MSFWKKESLKKIPVAQKFFQKEDKRKLKKLVTGKNFDLFIMSIILADAVVLGMMTIDFFRDRFEQGLFLLDRLFMAIFIVEMVMKIYAERREFWKSGWNVFDFVIVAVSSVPAASAFIVIRSLRLFRMFKYIYQASGINNIITTFCGFCRYLFLFWPCSPFSFMFFPSSRSVCMAMSLWNFQPSGRPCRWCCRLFPWMAGRQALPVRSCGFFPTPGCFLPCRKW